MIGNVFEVIEVIEVLKGKGYEDLKNFCIEFVFEMMIMVGVEKEKKLV